MELIGTEGTERARSGPPSSSPDPEVQALLKSLSGRRAISAGSAAEAREKVAGLRAVLDAGPTVHAVHELSIPAFDGSTVAARRYQHGLRPTADVVLYFHGGGWVTGGIPESDGLARRLARSSGVDVVSVGYRLAPEHRFPAAIDDADATFRWLAGQDGTGRVVLVGDSAGGNLATVLARRCRDRGDDTVALQVLVYPVCDPALASESVRKHGEGFLVTAADMRWFWAQYVPDPSDRRSADAAPSAAADLAGLPPALLVIAEYDVLRDECFAYARRLREAGVEVTVDHYETMIHGFFSLVGPLSAAGQAVDSVASAIADALRV